MNLVEFPGLWGLKLPVDPVAFTLPGIKMNWPVAIDTGPISIYWYGIIIASALMLAVLLGMKDSKKYGIEQDHIIDLVLWAAPIAVVCARLYYVVFSWGDYRDNLKEIFNIRHGGLAIYGGLIGALLVAYFFARYKKIGILNLLDFGLPYFALAQAVGRWGNFVNQEAFGRNTALPWGMTSEKIKSDLFYYRDQGANIDPNLPVHPTFLYESLWNLGVFFLLIWFRKRRKLEGEVFALYMVMYGLGRFWIEGLRMDSLMLGSLRISQVLAALFAIAFAAVFYLRRKKAVEAAQNEITELGKSEYGGVLSRMKQEEGQQTDGDADGGSGQLPEDTGQKQEDRDKNEI